MMEASGWVYPLDNSYTWKIESSEAMLILLKDGNPFAGGKIQKKNFSFWKEKFMSLRSTESGDFSIKIIGSEELIPYLVADLKKIELKIEKAIPRNDFFTVIYDKNKNKFQASAPQNKKIRVCIVDDSPTIHQVLKKVFSFDADIEVVAAFTNPLEVEAGLANIPVDVMTLDIHMEGMDGVSLLKKILPKYKIPTVMISSMAKEEGPHVLEALETGAVDYIQKPSMKEMGMAGPLIIERVKNAAQAKVASKGSIAVRKVSGSYAHSSDSIIAIGSSTGGTEALRVLFESMPDEIPPIVVVQHIPPVFSKALADRLNTLCKFEVKEAEHGDEVKSNRVLIAPGGKQMGFRKSGKNLFIVINDDAPVNRHKPSVDYMFDSLMSLKKENLVGVILTGMGNDGAVGLKKMRELGGRTLAQDKESSVVWGMPREAAQNGGAEFVLPLTSIAEKILQLSQSKSMDVLKKIS